MKSLYCLYETVDSIIKELEKNEINTEDKLLIKIFTSKLNKEQAYNLAKEIKVTIPNANIIGSSVSAIMHNNIQHEDETLIVVDRFEKAHVRTGVFEWEDKSVLNLANEINSYACNSDLMQIFFGGYYDYTHQFMERFNKINKRIKIVGGMAGETSKDITPFVFTDTEVIEKGVVLSCIQEDTLSIFTGINTANKEISGTFTITKSNNKEILEIDNQPATKWTFDNLGNYKKHKFDKWKDIASNDPLIHFQIVLENSGGASRYIRYNEEKDVIEQYFSRLEEGTRFKLSYNSPLRCAEELSKICNEIAIKPVESIFYYGCLFRKLYLENCAKWEIGPFKKYNLCGVFLLGEIAYLNGKNQLLNGGSIISGIGENENYINPDMEILNNLNLINIDSKMLNQFIIERYKNEQKIEENTILNNYINEKSRQRTEFYIDSELNINNMLKYSRDIKIYNFNKLCMINVEKIENIAGIISQEKYINEINILKEDINTLIKENSIDLNLVKMYSVSGNALLLACNNDIDGCDFERVVNKIYDKFKYIQLEGTSIFKISKIVYCIDEENTLEKIYDTINSTRDKQLRLIKYNKFMNRKRIIEEESEMLGIINYAIQTNNIIPYYQGIHNNKTNEIDKYEALIRIKDKYGRVYSPSYFMDIIKKYNLYLNISQQMIENVFNDKIYKNKVVSINLSAYDINSNSTKNQILTHLKKCSSPQNIIFEIVEGECFENIEVLEEFVRDIKKYGANIAIDDFGSGYSNLLETIRINPKFIKIDGQIIKDINSRKENNSVLKMVSSLAKELDIETVAEFVENEEVQSIIEGYGVDYSQGYLFSKPQPKEDIVLYA